MRYALTVITLLLASILGVQLSTAHRLLDTQQALILEQRQVITAQQAHIEQAVQAQLTLLRSDRTPRL
jgi:hypothetical protein